MNKIVNYDTKKDALYIECVVLVNGESDPELYKDSQGDTWDSKTIKQVFTSEANQTQHDLYHNKEKVEGVTTISNYISTTDKIIANKTVPSGSWIKELMITDPDIIEMVKSNQINGVSPNFRLHENSVCVKELKNIKGNFFYNSDIQNKECMKPIFLSLVDEPANEYGLEVFSYDKYLSKSKNAIGGKNMSKLKEMIKSILDYVNETEEEKAELEKAEAPAPAEDEAASEEEVKEEEEEEPSELEAKIEELTSKFDELLKRVEALESAETKEEEDEEVVEAGSEEEEEEAESQKSKQPQIRVKEEKLDDVELEKQNTKERTNHLGFPIKSTTELAKNKFNF